jgi:hypothetical protein
MSAGTLWKRISADRIAVGTLRLGLCLTLVTVGVMVWRLSGVPYQNMEARVAAIPEAYATTLDSGADVYYATNGEPERLSIQVGSAPFVSTAEPRLITEAVTCIKNAENRAVRVIEHLSPIGPIHFQEQIVLFDNRKTAEDVFSLYAPVAVNPDFRNIDPDGRLDNCVAQAYGKYRTEMQNNIRAAKRDFYLEASTQVMGMVVAEILACAALYWILIGFFRGRA